jgi:hypothetical protein
MEIGKFFDADGKEIRPEDVISCEQLEIDPEGSRKTRRSNG